ncbi:MAG: hypothetical protein K2X32_03000, partial [Phycisphaerales bacterium]|nr:hypothetical protein [Phycisphaerales bacterium]
MDARLSALESAVRSAGETLASLERQQVIERALVEARAIAPLTAARALAGALKDRPGVSIEKLVKELRSTRPELFRPAGGGAGARRGGAGVMGPIGAERSGGEATGAARDD